MQHHRKPNYPKPAGARPQKPPFAKPAGPPPPRPTTLWLGGDAAAARCQWAPAAAPLHPRVAPLLLILLLLLLCALALMIWHFPLEAAEAFYLLGLRSESPLLAARAAAPAAPAGLASLYAAAASPGAPPPSAPAPAPPSAPAPPPPPPPPPPPFPRLPPSHLPAAYQCTPAERAAQVALLNPAHSNCFSAHYWAALFAAGFACRDVVAVDVGANKGYLLAHWADLLRPQLNVTPASLHAAFFSVEPLRSVIDPAVACGACGDCGAGHQRTRTEGARCVPAAGGGGGGGGGAAEHSLHLWALEPVPGNVVLLAGGVARAVAEGAAAAGDARVALHVEQVALVGDPALRTVPVGVCPPGRETCGVRGDDGVAGGPGAYTVGVVDVNASTLDAWVEARGLGARPIDVLAIDTEGLDAPVLAGGGALLARGGVRLLVFEYHNFRAWRETELRGVVAALDAHGYDCFLLQKKLALRLTGCWAPEFEFRAWSNVMCAYRAEEALLAALASFAVVPEVPGGGARAR
jgi:hypothetical protein